MKDSLRIFQTMEAYANSAVKQNRTWHRNLHEPLLEMGHDVVLLPSDEGRQAMRADNDKARATFSQKLLDRFRVEHRRKPFDLFFAYLTDGMVDPLVIDEIRKHGVPMCNFSCNNAHQFYLVSHISKHFDYNLHSEKDTRNKFLSVGANPFWWPMASNPRYFKPVDVSRTVSVSFVGTNYALRARYIAHLLENKVDLHVYGPGWRWGGARTKWRSLAKRYLLLRDLLTALSRIERSRASSLLAEHDLFRYLSGRFPNNLHIPLSDDELIALYSRSHISLGFVEVYDQHDPSRSLVRHVHLRDFEAPLSGAFYCTGYVDEIVEFFEPDKEIILYRNETELLDNVQYYLAHPEQAETIRQAGHRRALADHTYHLRFQRLFKELNLLQ